MASIHQAGSVNFSVPLQISVSIGTPVLTSPNITSPNLPSLHFTGPNLTGPNFRVAIAGSPGGAREGQFSSSPPAIDTAPFHRSSLSQTTFTWKAALSMALASKLAYESESSVESTCMGSGRAWGFSSCEFIDIDDTQCFVAMTPEIALVSFRGTESRGDWFGNVNVPGRSREYGVVHRGFLGAFQAVESRLRTALAGIAGRKLILTGHSLGGALATVMAAEWQTFMPASWIVTFGQPAVGSGSFKMFILQNYSGKFFRFVNDADIVPRVPPGYDHVGRLMHFDARGNLRNGQSLPSTERAIVESMQVESIQPNHPMLTEAEYQALQAQIGQEVVRLNRPLTESPMRPLTETHTRQQAESHTRPQIEGFFTTFSDHSLDEYIAKIAPNARS